MKLTEAGTGSPVYVNMDAIVMIRPIPEGSTPAVGKTMLVTMAGMEGGAARHVLVEEDPDDVMNYVQRLAIGRS